MNSVRGTVIGFENASVYTGHMTDIKRGLFNRRKKQPPKPKGNYAFIDSQNLNLGVQRAGFKMDWKKFRVYLEEKHNVTKAFMFIGYMPENEDLYKQMQDAGYLVALKPTLDMMLAEGDQDKEKIPTKGNVDTELVMYVMKELRNYDKAIIVSGDGDFYSLIEYIKNKNKLHAILVPNWKYSTLLKPFEDKITRIDELRKELSYRGYQKNTSKKRPPKKQSNQSSKLPKK